MSGTSPKNAGISPAGKSQVLEMNAAVEARWLIEQIAGPQPVGGKIKQVLDLIVKRTGLPHRRVRGLWNGEARAILSEEMDALRRAAKSKAHPNEFDVFAARLAAVEARLSTIDPEFHRSSADALRDLHGRVRSLADGGGQ